MWRTAAMVIALGLGLAASAMAEGRPVLGWGRLFTNDFIGDGNDRWRTGGYSVSQIRGTSWDGIAPATPGRLIEWRARAEIIAPDNLRAPAPGDRRYAGTLSFGAHTHFTRGAAEVRLGADLVVTGPVTGMGDFQDSAHELFGATDPAAALAGQIPNALHPTLSAEIGRSFRLGERVRLRPFLEARAGVETLVRVGGDLVIGRVADGALMLRDEATGQRYRALTAGTPVPGISLLIGGDIAHVAASDYLGSAILEDTRERLRAGVHWQGARASMFYGATWLSEEFLAQPEGQVVGSVQFGLRF